MYSELICDLVEEKSESLSLEEISIRATPIRLGDGGWLTATP
jgi:hypothetical protein